MMPATPPRSSPHGPNYHTPELRNQLCPPTRDPAQPIRASLRRPHRQLAAGSPDWSSPGKCVLAVDRHEGPTLRPNAPTLPLVICAVRRLDEAPVLNSVSATMPLRTDGSPRRAPGLYGDACVHTPPAIALHVAAARPFVLATKLRRWRYARAPRTYRVCGHMILSVRSDPDTHGPGHATHTCANDSL